MGAQEDTDLSRMNLRLLIVSSPSAKGFRQPPEAPVTWHQVQKIIPET